MKSAEVTIDVQHVRAVDIDRVDLGGKYVYRGSREKDAWPHDAWRATLTYQGRTYSTDYKTGIGHRTSARNEAHGFYDGPETARKGIEAASVLYCLFSDASSACETFEEWCGDMGYDSDSRKALDTYLTCQGTRKALQKLFGADYSTVEEETRDA